MVPRRVETVEKDSAKAAAAASYEDEKDGGRELSSLIQCRRLSAGEGVTMLVVLRRGLFLRGRIEALERCPSLCLIYR